MCTHHEIEQEVKEAKTKNIILAGMAFSSMTRVFSEGSTAKIVERLEQFFEVLDRVGSREEYDRLHADFCRWFMQTIHLAVRPTDTSSYGHAAKVLNIAAKVYVYYCALPSLEAARALVPLLHAALDNRMIGHLRSRFPDAGITARAIVEVDHHQYERLRSAVDQEIRSEFHSQIHPVHYDDVMWRRLNVSQTPEPGRPHA